eukprot:scaffold2442_cov146-Cylindrotheca_fusiformis.AAC.11
MMRKRPEGRKALDYGEYVQYDSIEHENVPGCLSKIQAESQPIHILLAQARGQFYASLFIRAAQSGC